MRAKGDYMRSVFIVGIVLAFITLAIYWQVGNHEFVNFDDDYYVYENKILHHQ